MSARKTAAGPIARCTAPIDPAGRFALKALRYAVAGALIALLPLPPIDLAVAVPDVRLPSAHHSLPSAASSELRCRQLAADFTTARADGRNESASLALARMQDMRCPIPNLAKTRTMP